MLSTLKLKLKARLATFKKLIKVCLRTLQSKLFLTKYKSKIMKLSKKRKSRKKPPSQLLLKKSYFRGSSWMKTNPLLKK